MVRHGHDQPWRVGRKLGRTLYCGDELVGLMDTPWLAARVVQAVNGSASDAERLAGISEALPALVCEARRVRGLSLRQVAAQTGLSFTTLSRIERGGDFNSRALPGLLRWLGEPW